MKAAYFNPQYPANGTSISTPMRAALDKAGIDVLDISGDRAGRIDVWIAEACATAEQDQLGPHACEQLGIPLVVVEPDPRVTVDDDRESALQMAVQATHIVTTSTATARYFEDIAPDKLTLMSTFIDVDPFRAAYKVRELHKSSLASKLRLPETSPWLLADVAMEAGDSLRSYEVLAVALSRLVFMDWMLIVVASGNAVDEAKRLMLRLPQDRIRYCDPMPLPDFAALCVSCDMYVWPSVGDASPGSLLEAQASGMPAIAGRKESTQDRLVDGRTGRLTPIGNAESFSGAISFLLRHPDFLRSFSEDARETAYAQHDLETAAARLGNILSGLC